MRGCRPPGYGSTLSTAGGFAGGYLAAKLLDPMKPERVDHVILGVACIVVSLVSIVVSFVHGMQFM